MSKGPQAFRTISETAAEVGVPQHVLRFWETKFDFITPVKRAGGRRFYRPQDVAVLRNVRRLLHEEGMTIRGVLKLQKEQGLAVPNREAGVGEGYHPSLTDRGPGALSADARERIEALLPILDGARQRLDAALQA